MRAPSTRQSGCGDESCSTPLAHTAIGTIFSFLPFLATFTLVSVFVSKKVFPQLSRVHEQRDGEDHYLPPSAPLTLQQAHAGHGARSLRRRIASVTFSLTVGLTTVLAELILSEMTDLVDPQARALALRFTIPTLLFLLVVLIPFLELQSIISGSMGWSFQRTAKGRFPRVAWSLQMATFGAWLFVFWSLGRAVPVANNAELYRAAASSHDSFDSTAMTIRQAAATHGQTIQGLIKKGRGLSRACLERIGVIGISLMALLSGFASVSSPWHTFADNRTYRRRPPITDAVIARKEAGLEATSEMLMAKRNGLRFLYRKMAMTEAGVGGRGSAEASLQGLVGKMIGSIKGTLGRGSHIAETNALQLEISGLEIMEANLASALALARARRAAHARDGTALGKLLAMPSYACSVYCICRILSTTVTTLRRMYYPAASFTSSDPINRFLGLLAKHWDPKLDQIAWARQISFLLSGVILVASAKSALQTFQLFAKWTPGLLYQAQANLALLIGQIAATYVISAALLLRSNLPREVGRSVGDALESALEPGFVDRWFEGWFLFASVATAVGIWLGRLIAGAPAEDWDGFDDYPGEEMAQKRS